MKWVVAFALFVFKGSLFCSELIGNFPQDSSEEEEEELIVFEENGFEEDDDF